MEPVGFEPTSIVIFITMSNPEGPIETQLIINPVADKKEEAKDEVRVEEKSMIPGSYRIMFAVVTISSVLVYDTQHEVRSFCFYYHVLCFIGYVFMNLWMYPRMSVCLYFVM